MATKKKIQKATGKYPFRTKGHGGSSNSRHDRREYMKSKGILKEAHSLRNTDFKGWCEYLRDQHDYGTRLHNEFLEDVMRGIKSQLTDLEVNIENSLNGAGLPQENIDNQLSKFRAANRRELTF